jgi:hypothetical protein
MASGSVFIFYVPGHVFGGTVGVGSRFQVLRSRTRSRWLRVRRVPFSRFTRSDSFSTVLRASGAVFKFCAPGLIFAGTDGVGSRFHILRTRTHFRGYRGRRVPFSYFAWRDTFSTVLRASFAVFMFCALGLVFGGAEGVKCRFQVLRARTRFRRYRWRRVPFSCFKLPVSFLTVKWVSGPVFMFCAPILIFDGTEGVGSRFHVLRFWTRFRRCRGRQVPFSCFALPDSFSAVSRASGPVFKLCAPGFDFGGPVFIF